jgi:hypothetical protein
VTSRSWRRSMPSPTPSPTAEAPVRGRDDPDFGAQPRHAPGGVGRPRRRLTLPGQALRLARLAFVGRFVLHVDLDQFIAAVERETREGSGPEATIRGAAVRRRLGLSAIPEPHSGVDRERGGTQLTLASAMEPGRCRFSAGSDPLTQSDRRPWYCRVSSAIARSISDATRGPPLTSSAARA